MARGCVIRRVLSLGSAKNCPVCVLGPSVFLETLLGFNSSVSSCRHDGVHEMKVSPALVVCSAAFLMGLVLGVVNNTRVALDNADADDDVSLLRLLAELLFAANSVITLSTSLVTVRKRMRLYEELAAILRGAEGMGFEGVLDERGVAGLRVSSFLNCTLIGFMVVAYAWYYLVTFPGDASKWICHVYVYACNFVVTLRFIAETKMYSAILEGLGENLKRVLRRRLRPVGGGRISVVPLGKVAPKQDFVADVKNLHRVYRQLMDNLKIIKDIVNVPLLVALNVAVLALILNVYVAVVDVMNHRLLSTNADSTHSLFLMQITGVLFHRLLMSAKLLALQVRSPRLELRFRASPMLRLDGNVLRWGSNF